MKKAAISVLLCLLILSSSIIIGFTGVTVRAVEDAVSGIPARIDGILQREAEKAGSNNLQAWLDGALTQGAGVTSDWLVFSIRQYNKSYNFSQYAAALNNYVKTDDGFTAVTKQRFALLFAAVGQNRDYVVQTVNSTIGEFGIMSWIYGLHLLNNGYTSSKTSTTAVVEKLLTLQLTDRGWALSGTVSDVDVTAMTLQALAPYYKTNTKVKAAVDAAITLLSQRQMSTGDFQSYGVGNSQSTAQVITALACLGINGLSDTRFIKNNNTLLDGLLQYQLADKSFSHTLGGSSNNSATAQALGAFVSVWRLAKSYGSFYMLSPAGTDTSQKTTQSQISEKTTAPPKPVSESTAQINSVSSTVESAVAPVTQEGAVAENTGGSVDATDETAENGETQQGEESTDSSLSSSSLDTYKKWIILAIALLAIGSCLVLILTGKGNKKNLLAVLSVTAVLIGTFLIVNTVILRTKQTSIETSTEFSMEPAPATLEDGMVSLYINCVNAVKYGIRDKDGYDEIIPENGVILDTSAEFQQGDTVLALLKSVLKDENIALSIKQGGYVAGISGLTEQLCGTSSGWIYSVNGIFPLTGTDEYQLASGDRVAFYYTVNKGDVPGKQDF